MGMCKGLDSPHYQYTRLFLWACESVRFFWVSFFPLAFFAIAVHFNYMGFFLIGVQCALTRLWLPAGAVPAALCAVVTGGQPLQVSGQSCNGKTHVCVPLGTSESLSLCPKLATHSPSSLTSWSSTI